MFTRYFFLFSHQPIKVHFYFVQVFLHNVRYHLIFKFIFDCVEGWASGKYGKKESHEKVFSFSAFFAFPFLMIFCTSFYPIFQQFTFVGDDVVECAFYFRNEVNFIEFVSILMYFNIQRFSLLGFTFFWVLYVNLFNSFNYSAISPFRATFSFCCLYHEQE